MIEKFSSFEKQDFRAVDSKARMQKMFCEYSGSDINGRSWRK